MAVLTTGGAAPTFAAACTGCGACLLTCPTHAIRPRGAGPAVLYAVESLCTGCGECVEVCPVDAVQLPLHPGEEDPCPKR